MISILVFNISLILVIIIPLALYLLSNTDYIFDAYCAVADASDIFESVIEIIAILIYFVSITGFVFAGGMFCDEIFSVTFALFTNVTMASLISFHTSMIMLAISCGIVIIELLLALPLLMGTLIWHQLHKSNASN